MPSTPEGDLTDARIFADLTYEPGDDAIDGVKVDTRRPRLRLWSRRYLGLRSGRPAARLAAPARSAAQPRLGRCGWPHPLRHRPQQHLPDPASGGRYPSRHPEVNDTGAIMSKGLNVGDVLPDFELPDENGVVHSLSELQGDDAPGADAGPRRALPPRAPAPDASRGFPAVGARRLHTAGHDPAERPARRLQDEDRHRCPGGRIWRTRI